MFTKVKTANEAEAMREGGAMLATVLEMLKKTTTVGMSTKQLADKAASELSKLGGKPAFLNYQGFPDVLCVSINEEVVHGIPRENKIINNGDIVSVDFGVIYKDLITDAALSFIVGKADKKVQSLLSNTEEAMYAGIKRVRNEVKTGDIGHAIQLVLDKQSYGIVQDLVGHGVGHHLHEDPNIPNYGHPGTGDVLSTGMTIAIEPMATLGTYKVFVKEDNWTIVTQDGSWAAHFEHTVLITDQGSEILTKI